MSLPPHCRSRDCAVPQSQWIPRQAPPGGWPAQQGRTPSTGAPGGAGAPGGENELLKCAATPTAGCRQQNSAMFTLDALP